MTIKVVHHWADNALSDCGEPVMRAYSARSDEWIAFSTSWVSVNCVPCLAKRPDVQHVRDKQRKQCLTCSEWMVVDEESGEFVHWSTDDGLCPEWT